MVKELGNIDYTELLLIPDERDKLKLGEEAVVTYWDGGFSTFLIRFDTVQWETSQDGICYELKLAHHAISKETFSREYSHGDN